MEDCPMCGISPSRVLLELDQALLVCPYPSHVSREDGGHLAVLLRRHVPSRLFATSSELAALDALSIAGAKVLDRCCGATWWNFQENGNWAASDPKTSHCHMHVYGRRPDSIGQIFGEAIMLPQRHEICSWPARSISDSDVEELRAHAVAVWNDENR